MSGVEIEVTRLPGHDPALPLPEYATTGAAGLDIRADLPAAARAAGLEIAPGGRALVPTGLALGIPAGYEAQMRPRSGLALRLGLTLLNSPGTIDCDYRGEIGIIMINHGAEMVRIEHGMRVAQMVVAPVVQARFLLVETLGDTARGTGGFGSTGTDRIVDGK